MSSQKSLSDELGNATSTELATVSQKKLKPCHSWVNGERPESLKTETVVPSENGFNGEHKVCCLRLHIALRRTPLVSHAQGAPATPCGFALVRNKCLYRTRRDAHRVEKARQ